MPSSPFLSKVRAMAVVHARPLLVALSLAWMLVILGCMSFSLGGRYCVPLDEPLCQEGEIRCAHGVEEVYYPIPYASTPNLEMNDRLGCYSLMEQHADHFKVRSICTPGPMVRWKARGVRATPGTPPALSPHVTPVPSLPPPALNGMTSSSPD